MLNTKCSHGSFVIIQGVGWKVGPYQYSFGNLQLCDLQGVGAQQDSPHLDPHEIPIC